MTPREIFQQTGRDPGMHVRPRNAGRERRYTLPLISSRTPTDGLDRAGINSILARTSITLVGTDYLGLLIHDFKYPGTDLCAVPAADTSLLINDRRLSHHRSFPQAKPSS